MSQTSPGATGASADAIELVLADHRTVEQLFKQFEAATATELKHSLGDRIIRELSVHAAIEEQILYPAAKSAFGDEGDKLVDHAIQEHQQLKEVLDGLDGKSIDEADTITGFAKAKELVDEHVAEEESDFLPRLRAELSQEDLQRLGKAMEAAKIVAPTHPHPNAPSTPPGNIVLGPIVALADKVRDAAREAFSNSR